MQSSCVKNFIVPNFGQQMCHPIYIGSFVGVKRIFCTHSYLMLSYSYPHKIMQCQKNMWLFAHFNFNDSISRMKSFCVFCVRKRMWEYILFNPTNPDFFTTEAKPRRGSAPSPPRPHPQSPQRSHRPRCLPHSKRVTALSIKWF